MYCHAGCSTYDILGKVGLNIKDLGSSNFNTTAWMDNLNQETGKDIEAVYDYRDEKGKYLYSKIRFFGKKIRYYTVNYTTGICTKGKPENIKSNMYNLPAALKAIKKGYPVYITEGEKDANTLKDLGLTAVTAGGVSDWKQEFCHYFTGAKVIILPDNDEPGLNLKDRIIKDLSPFAHSIKWAITSETEHGDVTDYLKEGHTKEELKELIDNTAAVYAPWIEVSEKRDGSTRLRVNPGLLAKSINDNLHYKIMDNSFYWYMDGYYKQINKNEVKANISNYLPDGFKTDSLLTNVYNLLLADLEHVTTPKAFNECEDYINFKNGLYNLNTKRLEPHTPQVLYTWQVNSEYDPNDNYKPVFDKFINDLSTDIDGEIDEQRRSNLSETMGLAISNVYGYRTKQLSLLHSLIGNTGKSQYLNLVVYLIGISNIINLAFQNMNEEKGKFALADGRTARLIMVGDQGKASVKDSSILKSIVSGDVIKGEAKGKDLFYFVFRGFMLIACNDLPYIEDDKGDHMYRRLNIIPSDHVISDKEKDPKIFDKMLKELPAIINWAIEGLHRLIENNYTFTKIDGAAVYYDDYRKASDTVYDFLTECEYAITKNPNDKVSRKILFEEYASFCIGNERISTGKRQFNDRLEKLTGLKVQRTRINNVRDYYTLGIKKADTDFIPLEENEQVTVFG